MDYQSFGNIDYNVHRHDATSLELDLPGMHHLLSNDQPIYLAKSTLSLFFFFTILQPLKKMFLLVAEFLF